MTKEEIEALLNKNLTALGSFSDGYKACAKDILNSFKEKVEIVDPLESSVANAH